MWKALQQGYEGMFLGVLGTTTPTMLSLVVSGQAAKITEPGNRLAGANGPRLSYFAYPVSHEFR